jgi:chromosome segregation protein
MYMKSLTLRGFKSFADRVCLTLEPGVTAIVGPNGSGKSNISDAVLWVLGERNPKHLRGQSMEDVIFAGSSARKSVSVAEVEIVLDNSDGTLPVEYQEVSLTRRMYRSGESEYLINGSQARRLDFMDILHDTGLGTGTHSIISQGNLDEVLASRPEDRRALIEEAAGVLKHKQRKERSARKIAQMQVQLDRARDIQAEVSRQLKPLARKAKRAEAYQGLADELAQLKLVLAVDDLRGLQKSYEDVQRREKECAASIDVCRLKSKQADDNLEQLQLLLQKRGLYAGDLAEQRSRFHMDVERLASTVAILDEKEHNITARLNDAKTSLSSGTERARDARGQLAEVSRQLSEQQALVETLQGEVDELDARYEQQKAGHADVDRTMADARVQLSDCNRKIDAVTSRRLNLMNDLAQATASHQTLQTRMGQIDEEVEQANREAAQAEERLGAENRKVEELRAQTSQASQALATARTDLEQARSALTDKTGQIQRISARIDALEHVNHALEAYNDASAWISDHAHETDASAHHLAEGMTVDGDFEPLVEALIGTDLASLMVSSPDAAHTLTNGLLAAQAQGSSTLFFSGGAASPHAQPGRIPREEVPEGFDRLVDHIQAPEATKRAVDLLIGDVVVVPSTQEAFEKDDARFRFVTPDGVIVRPGCSVRRLGESAQADGILARQRDIEELSGQLEQERAAHADLEERCKDAESRVAQAQAEHSEAQRNLAEHEGAQRAAQAEQRRTRERAQSLENSRNATQQRLETLDQTLSTSQPAIDAASQQLEEMKARKAELEQQVSALEDRRSQAISEEGETSAARSEKKLARATAAEHVRTLQRERDQLDNDVRRFTAQAERAQRQAMINGIIVERIPGLRDILTRLGASAQQRVDDLASKAALEQSQSASLNASISEAREKARAAKEQLDAATAAESDVRVEKGRLEVQVDAAVETITQDCGVPLEDALQAEPPDDREQAEQRAGRLSKRISTMGTIDSSAREEYEEVKERYDYLTRQIDDMDAARLSLKRIVAAIDARMQQQFDQTFEAVNENFSQIFSVLFPGGSASLELVGGEDGQPQGVEVNAQPRGKRLTKMSLMSGGEKSLTALALLFSVYKIRSTPFYIMDEVEAALDDSNLRRLTAYLETLRHETQLIMITHQRRTMEMADTLYGVSMQSDGVTKVVSQKLDHQGTPGR